MTNIEITSFTISVIAILISVFNFFINLRWKKRSRKIQDRNDRIEVDNLLDKAYECLYGKGGFSSTKDKQKFYDAEAAVLRAKEINDSYSRVIEYEGMCMEVQGKIDKAIEKYNQAIKLKPLRGNTYNMLGRLYEDEKAINYFRKAIQVNPEKSGLPLYNIANRLKKMNKFDEAKDTFLQSLEYLPNYEYTHYELGNIYYKEKKFKESRLSYEKAISINPSYIDAMVSLGSMIAQNIDWSDGVAWIEQAMKVNPTDGHPYAMMAALYADKKDPENALKYYGKAIDIDPKYRLSNDVLQDLRREMLEMKNSNNQN